MKIHRAIAVVAVLGLPLPMTAAHAADIKLLGGNALNGPFVNAPSEPAPVVEGDLPVMLQMYSMNNSGNSW